MYLILLFLCSVGTCHRLSFAFCALGKFLLQ